MRSLSRILVLLLFCVADAICASAVPITLNSYSLGNWPYAGTTATLKIFANQDFLTSDGQLIKAGNAATGAGWYRSISCTVSGTTVTVPSITNFSTTTDSLTLPTATFTARFYDYRGIAREYFQVNFQVKHTYASPTSWDVVYSYNHPQGPPPDRTYPTFDQMGAAINAMLPGPNASSTIKGISTLSVDPLVPSNPIAVGDRDPRLPTQSENDALVGTNGTPSSSNKYVTQSDPVVTQVFNVKTYGAVGDGLVNDTAAVQAALGAALAAHGRLYVPTGDYRLTGATGTEFLLVNKSIEIYGDGALLSRLIVDPVASVGTSKDGIRIQPPANNAVNNWLQAGGRDNMGYYFHDFAIQTSSEPSVLTDPYPSQPGRFGIHVDVSAANSWFFQGRFERLYIGSFSSFGMYFDNLNIGTGSYRNLDGIWGVTIRDNTIRNGIAADYWGDTIDVLHNYFVGINAGIISSQVTGATTLNIQDNSFTSRGGGAIFHNGDQINFLNNICEEYVVPSTGSTGACVDFRGDVARINGVTVSGNIFNTHIVGNELDGVRVDNAYYVQFAHNTFNTPASGTHYAVKTTATARNTVFGQLNSILSGTATLTNTTSNDPNPIYGAHTISSEPLVSSPATFIKNYLGVERVYSQSVRVSGGATPLTPTAGAGGELWFDSDGRILNGGYSGSGGSGAFVFQSVDRDAGPALRDFYLAADKGMLNFSGGVEFPHVAFSALPSSHDGVQFYCDDCKNVVDDGATAGAACASAGTGSFAKRTHSKWVCN